MAAICSRNSVWDIIFFPNFLNICHHFLLWRHTDEVVTDVRFDQSINRSSGMHFHGKLSEIFWAYTLNHWLFSKFTEGDIGFNCCVIQLSGGLKAPGWQRNKILMWFFSTCCCHDLSKNPRRKDLSKGQDFYHSKVLWYPTSLSNRTIINFKKTRISYGILKVYMEKSVGSILHLWVTLRPFSSN